jgi:hypothetical protein
VMFSIDSRFRKRGYVLYARELLATMLILTCNQEDWIGLVGGFGMSQLTRYYLLGVRPTGRLCDLMHFVSPL